MSRPEQASPAARRLLLGLLAAYLFLWWALFAAIDGVGLGWLFYFATHSFMGLCAAAFTVVAATFQWRAWRHEAELALAVLTSIGAAVAVFALVFALEFGPVY